ncbi:MAG: CHASE2 and HATPase_c domain-containing protein [Anaerolineae bacterium]|nr:CHASE2 and HATPase_c domain-containing protein [Anaerolineae bacterium]NUQ02458.1 CHASE2 domain-containing protein [Anaerolineae bacterium]
MFRAISRRQDQILITACSALLVIGIWSSGLLTTFRLRLSDLFFVGSSSSVVGSERADDSAPISIIAIDDRSLQAYGRSPNEWDRAVYGELVDFLSESGARVIAFDLIFSETGEGDTALAAALNRARTGVSRTRIVLPIAGADTLTADSNLPTSGIRFPSSLRPIAPLAEQADYLAYVNTVIDVDGLIRRQPSFIETDNGGVTFSFSLATYLAYLRIPAAAASQLIAAETGRFSLAGATVVYHDDLGFWRQNFFGVFSSPFPIYSLTDVVNGSVDAAVFDDQIVLVGLVNSQGVSDNYYIPLTSDGRPIAGVEILAHAITTLLRNSVPYEQGEVSTILMIVLASMLSTAMYLRLRWYGKLVVAPLMLLGLFVFASVNFSLRTELISLFDGTLALLLPMGLSLGYEIRIERHARERAEQLFRSSDGQRRLLDAVFMRSPLPLIIVNRDLQIIRSNRTFDAQFGSGSPNLLARLSHGGLPENSHDNVRRSLLSGDSAPTKVTVGEKAFVIQSAPVYESDFVVAALTDVTSLDQLAALKTRLIRIAAHDIRNPLSSIIGFSDLLLLDVEAYSKKQIDMLERIKRSAESINTIMVNLLKLEQLRSSKLPLEPVLPSLWLSQVAEGHAPEMERHQHEFILDIAEDMPSMMAEPIQLGQAVSNLLSNAAKYTPDGGRIVLHARMEGAARLRIEVQDNGLGIPTEAQSGLFTEFYRVQHGAAADRQGTGLGLSLVKTIVEAHHGRVWLESDEGEGSTFFMELPVNDGTYPERALPQR